MFTKGSKTYWSLKYEKCIKCGTIDINHKAYGYCKNCYEKKRNKKDLVIKHKKEYYIENKSKFLENARKNNKKYYWRDPDLYRLLKIIGKRKRLGKPCMKLIINGKEFLLPFDSMIEKSFHTYEEYKKQQQEFLILKKYYETRKY